MISLTHTTRQNWQAWYMFYSRKRGVNIHWHTVTDCIPLTPFSKWIHRLSLVKPIFGFLCISKGKAKIIITDGLKTLVEMAPKPNGLSKAKNGDWLTPVVYGKIWTIKQPHKKPRSSLVAFSVANNCYSMSTARPWQWCSKNRIKISIVKTL